MSLIKDPNGKLHYMPDPEDDQAAFIAMIWNHLPEEFKYKRLDPPIPLESYRMVFLDFDDLPGSITTRQTLTKEDFDKQYGMVKD